MPAPAAKTEIDSIVRAHGAPLPEPTALRCLHPDRVAIVFPFFCSFSCAPGGVAARPNPIVRVAQWWMIGSTESAPMGCGLALPVVLIRSRTAGGLPIVRIPPRFFFFPQARCSALLPDSCDQPRPSPRKRYRASPPPSSALKGARSAAHPSCCTPSRALDVTTP